MSLTVTDVTDKVHNMLEASLIGGPHGATRRAFWIVSSSGATVAITLIDTHGRTPEQVAKLAQAQAAALHVVEG